MITIRFWDIGVIVFVTICKEKQPLHIGYNIMLQQGQNTPIQLKFYKNGIYFIKYWRFYHIRLTTKHDTFN
jgi:hypothetical protein